MEKGFDTNWETDGSSLRHGKEQMEEILRVFPNQQVGSVRGGRTGQCDLHGVVVGYAIDKQEERINAGLVGGFVGDEGVGRAGLGDVDQFAKKRLAVLAVFFRLGEGANVHPVVHGDLDLVALGVGLVFVGFDVNGDIVFAVGPFAGGGFDSAI
jgi:hypothetical protein